MSTRREFIKQMVLLTGSAGLSYSMPDSIKRALAINPQRGSTYMDAEHVVILMQENRSFDHCFGTLRGVRGYNDPRAINLPDKNPVWLQSSKEGNTYAPFRFDIHDTKITWMGSVPHSRSSQVDANNSGKYDQWIDSKRSGHQKYAKMPLTMGHYTRNDLPFNYAMADAFTICDQHFCSAMTSTWPNRLYLWSGTIRGEKNGDAKAYIRNSIPYGEAHWKTMPEWLEESDISWRVYQNEIRTGGGFSGEERSWLSNFGCNPLEFLSQYNVRFAPRYIQGLQNQINTLPDEIASLEEKIATLPSSDKQYDKIKRAIKKKKEVLINAKNGLEKWSGEQFDKLTQEQKNLFKKAFITNKEDPDYRELSTMHYDENGTERELPIPKGDILYQFREDVNSGQLPTVSWLVPPQNFSDHPSAPWYGAWYTSEILDILTKNPEVWKKTVFILTYDENDGYFDHIPPFVAPDPHDSKTGRSSSGVNVSGVEYIRREQKIKEGISKKRARSGPIGLGFRVPMIIASPWSRGGNICSEVFDHTSVLQFLEHFLNQKYNKQIEATNISDWRRTVCGNLTSAFRLNEGEPTENPPFLSKDPFLEKIYNAKFKKEPSDFKKLSSDEIEQIRQDPASSPFMPQQEPGIRPSRALPYQLYVEGCLTKDEKGFELTMEAQNEVFGTESSGSPFKVYAPGKYVTPETDDKEDKIFESVRTWDYAVSAGDALKDTYPLNAFKAQKYHLRVYGPNGFFREFRGKENDPLVDFRCGYERKRSSKNELTGNIKLNLSNLSNKEPLTIIVLDNAYDNSSMTKQISVSDNENIVLNLEQSYGWYDFTVKVKGYDSFIRRYSGRVETGNDSFSDPAMGGEV